MKTIAIILIIIGLLAFFIAFCADWLNHNLPKK